MIKANELRNVMQRRKKSRYGKRQKALRKIVLILKETGEKANDVFNDVIGRTAVFIINNKQCSIPISKKLLDYIDTQLTGQELEIKL